MIYYIIILYIILKAATKYLNISWKLDFSSFNLNLLWFILLWLLMIAITIYKLDNTQNTLNSIKVSKKNKYITKIGNKSLE